MKHLNSYELFERYSINTGGIVIPESIKKAFKDNIGWNPGIEECVKMCCKIGDEMSTKGHYAIGKVNVEKQNVFVKIMTEYQFPGNPKVVSDKVWESLEKKYKKYYRGVGEFDYIDKFKYGTNKFTGSANFYQGTWMTDDKAYARQFSNSKDDRTVMELLLNPSAKLMDEDSTDGTELDNTIRKLDDEISVIKDDSIGKDKFDVAEKYIFHSADYIRNYLVYNKSFILIALGTDGAKLKYQGLNRDLDSDVLVVFNKEKLIVKE